MDRDGGRKIVRRITVVNRMWNLAKGKKDGKKNTKKYKGTKESRRKEQRKINFVQILFF